MAVPPNRRAGQIPRPRAQAHFDPDRHFSLAAYERLDAKGFRAALAQALAKQPPNRREVIVFVHGFNTHFIEGVYRVAQLGHDLGLSGVRAHYSWPSLGEPLAYAHDRDSVLFARDGLEQMLNEIFAARPDGVVVIGHSMGALLVMETLRQLAISGRLNHALISAVVIIAPDIDVDVFRMQARRIGNLPQPLLIVVSERDRIVALSARLTGLRDRLGNLSDFERLADLDVTLVDVTAFSTGAGHFDVARSPALIQLLASLGAVDAALAGDPAGRLPLLPRTVLTLQATAEILLDPLGEGRGTGHRLLPGRPAFGADRALPTPPRAEPGPPG